MNESSKPQNLVDYSEETMVSPLENTKKTQLLKPSSSSNVESKPVRPELDTLSQSVSFRGWNASREFKTWALKMEALHKPILGDPFQKLASGVNNGDETSKAYDESNIHISVGAGTQGQDKETMKSNELDVCGSDADMMDDSSEELNILLQEDGSIVGEKASLDEKLCSEVDDVDNDRLVQCSAIPCVTPMFFQSWKKTFQEFQQEEVGDGDNAIVGSNEAISSSSDEDVGAGGNTIAGIDEDIPSSSSDEDVGAGGSSSSKKTKQTKGSGKKPIGKLTLNPTDPGWPKDVPDTFETCELDWSKEDVLREEVTDQGLHELCWAVAFRESIEGALNIKAKKEKRIRHPKLSAQHLVNNVAKLKNGAMRRYDGVTQFLVNEGLVPEVNCEFTGSILQKGCNHATPDPEAVTKIRGVRCVKGKHINEEDLIKLVTERPVMVEMRAFESLVAFKGDGIYQGPTRKEEDKWNRISLSKNPMEMKKLIRHALLLIGYGTINGVHYWIVKNSYGTGWGKGGYGKIIRQCSSGNDKSLFVKIRYPMV